MEQTSESTQHYTITNAGEDGVSASIIREATTGVIASVDGKIRSKTIMGEEGVSVRESRKNTGQWQPGQSGNPNGRPTKAQELAILDAIRNTFPPDVIAAKLKRALELAENNESARGIVAVLEFAANYTLGKPVQRIVQESSGIVGVLAELGITIDE